jgi:hypothetical protein
VGGLTEKRAAPSADLIERACTISGTGDRIAGPAEQPPRGGAAEARAPRGQESAREHDRKTEHQRAAITDALTDHGARQRQHDTGQQIESDQHAELRVAHSNVGDEQRRD